uniref:Uncharacterized protein n=1 Tax=Boodleopsis pusilla TaxID=381415 RepID=A0A386AZJ5_9CHLO|nr:hypothetical protein [Boodleopsis pusilla]AYC64865.1 hypothetical protein [Boodleopsis pusilla]
MIAQFDNCRASPPTSTPRSNVKPNNVEFSEILEMVRKPSNWQRQPYAVFVPASKVQTLFPLTVELPSQKRLLANVGYMKIWQYFLWTIPEMFYNQMETVIENQNGYLDFPSFKRLLQNS